MKTEGAQTIIKDARPKQHISWFSIFFLVFIVCMIACLLFFIEGKINANNEIIETVALTENSGCAIGVENNIGDTFDNTVRNYADVILGVITSIGIALISIGATIFIFSKSALDRINDENEYISGIVRIHKESNIKILFRIGIGSVLLMLMPILGHGLLTFIPDYPTDILFKGIIALVMGEVAYLVASFLFWHQCVCVEKAMRKIIKKELRYLKTLCEEVIPDDKETERLEIIGDWACWDDDNAKYKQRGIELCRSMTQDRFVEQFQKAERLLLSGEFQQRPSLDFGSIVTIFQERMNIMKPNLRVEKIDLQDRKYRSNNEKVMECIVDYERCIGFDNAAMTESSNEGNSFFFENTEHLYIILKRYHNLLMAEIYTRIDINSKKLKKENNDILEQDMCLNKFAEAYYLFFLRILGLFVSAVKIKDYSFNGYSLNYANFYNATLESITLYSASFYRTVFSRTKFDHVIMDLSRLFDIDFYCTKIVDSSFNNSYMENLEFKHAIIDNGDFDSCDIKSCKMESNNFKNCIFNNSAFENIEMTGTNFAGCKFRNTGWKEKCILSSCSFLDSELYAWTVMGKLELKGCVFTNTTWDQMKINRWDLSDSVFDDANLIGIEIKNTSMKSSSFLRCHLENARIENCNMSGSGLQAVSLFEATLNNVDLSMTDLSNATAVKACFKGRCNLEMTNCANADFSEAHCQSIKFKAAKLNNCCMSKSTIENSDLTYILADHLQFTFAECLHSNFNMGSMSDSNLTGTTFDLCKFEGTDMTSLNATEVIFNQCILENVNFSNTRFYNAKFCDTTSMRTRSIKNCDFSLCKFEKVDFENVFFKNCIFEKAIFIKCEMTIHDKKFVVGEETFQLISDIASSNIQWVS